MATLVHELLWAHLPSHCDEPALSSKARAVSYGELQQEVLNGAAHLRSLGIAPGDRVGIYLPKVIEAVTAILACSAAGAVFVPINPVLKARQVTHILSDSGARALVTSAQRAAALTGDLPATLQHISLTDTAADPAKLPALSNSQWPAPSSTPGQRPELNTTPGRIDADTAAILYTSGSTGLPKGVVLSHRNIIAGAASVAEYLKNTAHDRLLAVLPLSFDYGLSQVTTALHVGASVHLLEYLLPRDVLRTLAAERITGLAAVPPLWMQLADLEWPPEIAEHLRYVTNSGGAMPVEITRRLQQKLPNTDVYLMYGLTEAFRSTYLPPQEIERRPNSIGKAIPNAEVMVVRPDGSRAEPGEAGELVHRGALVAKGYWNNEEKTAERFKPLALDPNCMLPEIAVFSGDLVTSDEDGYLYFVSRNDEMIKTSGYRVSPTEIEETLYGTDLVVEAVAMGIPDERLGHAIALSVVLRDGQTVADITRYCRTELPNYMVPSHIVAVPELPRNPNGKLDRPTILQNTINEISAGE